LEKVAGGVDVITTVVASAAVAIAGLVTAGGTAITAIVSVKQGGW
jgi:hypothetical protein